MIKSLGRVLGFPRFGASEFRREKRGKDQQGLRTGSLNDFP